MNAVLITNCTFEELKEAISELNSRSVESELHKLHPTVAPNNILTRQQTAELLSISLPTLHDYTKRGIIQSHRLGTKVRYKREDIEAALKQTKISNHLKS